MLNWDAEAFKDFIKSTMLVDIFPKSGTFTWNNKRGGDRQITSRLDKFLVTETILLEGITVDSDILPSGGSDHWPIIMNVAILGTPRNKPFRFEKFWLSHPKFTSKIKQWWIEPIGIRGTRMYILQAKLKHIKNKLKSYNQEVFGNIFKEKKVLEDQLEQIHKEWIQGNINQETMNTKQTLMQNWQARCQQEEILWKQKSRIQWLKEGEKNTKFFHLLAIDHRSANKILRIKDEQWTSFQRHHEILVLLINHFSQIALECSINREDAIRDLMTSISNLITEDQNKALNQVVTLEEVEEAVRDMPNGKAPRPDGFTIDFYKAC